MIEKISRRRFLRSAAVAAAGAVVTSCAIRKMNVYLPIVAYEAELPTQIIKGVGRHKYYPLDCQELLAAGVTWLYDWSVTPEVCDGVEAVPMIYSRSGVSKLLGGSSAWVLGFNEPDMVSQSNISPQAAVPLWAQVEANNPHRLLVAPAPAGDLVWLRALYGAFITEYGHPPRLNALAVHFYASGTVADASRALRQKLRAYRAQADEWGVDQVWLTEFAHLTQGAAFLREVLPWLGDECDRFAWFQWEYLGTEAWAFGAEYNTSLWLNGTLTEVGEVYAG